MRSLGEEFRKQGALPVCKICHGRGLYNRRWRRGRAKEERARMSLCSRRVMGAQGPDGPHAASVGLANTGLAMIMTAGFWLLTRGARAARRAVVVGAARGTSLMCGDTAGPKSVIYHFAVKALLTLI